MVTNGSANQLWLLGNGAVQSTVNLPVLGSAWQVAGIGDLDGDGDKDILYKFQYDATVECGVFMNGAALAGQDQVFNKVADAVSPLSASNQGNDTVLSSISYTLGNGVENLTLASGAGAIDGTGNALANAITGNEGTNRIAGLGGVDSMTGNGGADTFVFASYLNGLATVTDFAPGIDVLEILAAGFGGGLTPGAAAALVTADSAVTASHAGTTGYFIFDNTGTGAGTVYWDPNGGTGDDAIALVALLGVTSLNPSDFHLV